MGEKLKSKKHLQNRFFWFLSRFLRVWLQSLKKVLIWPKVFFSIKKVSKTQNFMLILNPLLKSIQKKSYKQHKFDEHE